MPRNGQAIDWWETSDVGHLSIVGPGKLELPGELSALHGIRPFIQQSAHQARLRQLHGTNGQRQWLGGGVRPATAAALNRVLPELSCPSSPMDHVKYGSNWDRKKADGTYDIQLITSFTLSRTTGAWPPRPNQVWPGATMGPSRTRTTSCIAGNICENPPDPRKDTINDQGGQSIRTARCSCPSRLRCRCVSETLPMVCHKRFFVWKRSMIIASLPALECRWLRAYELRSGRMVVSARVRTGWPGRGPRRRLAGPPPLHYMHSMSRMPSASAFSLQQQRANDHAGQSDF